MGGAPRRAGRGPRSLVHRYAERGAMAGCVRLGKRSSPGSAPISLPSARQGVTRSARISWLHAATSSRCAAESYVAPSAAEQPSAADGFAPCVPKHFNLSSGDPAATRTRAPRHHEHLPAGHRQQRDHRHRARTTVSDDLRQRRSPAEALGRIATGEVGTATVARLSARAPPSIAAGRLHWPCA